MIPRFYYQSNFTNDLDSIKIRPNLGRKIFINYLNKRKHSEQVMSLIQLCIAYWDT